MKILKLKNGSLKLFATLTLTVIIQMIDAILTAALVDQFGWGGERNTLILPIIQTSDFYFVGIKLVVMTIVVAVELWLYFASKSTRKLQLKFLNGFNLVACGVLVGNLLALLQGG